MPTVITSFLTLVAIFFCLMGVGTTARANKPPEPTPLGIEIGATACPAAAARLSGRAVPSDEAGVFHIVSTKPAELYQGAVSIEAWCVGPNGVVEILNIRLSKGGMGNPAVIEAYANLAAKYKRVAGGPPPRVGNGYARFESGSSIIELRAPHLSFEFEVAYMTRLVYGAMQASEEIRRQEEAKAKRERL